MIGQGGVPSNPTQTAPLLRPEDVPELGNNMTLTAGPLKIAPGGLAATIRLEQIPDFITTIPYVELTVSNAAGTQWMTHGRSNAPVRVDGDLRSVGYGLFSTGWSDGAGSDLTLDGDTHSGIYSTAGGVFWVYAVFQLQ